MYCSSLMIKSQCSVLQGPCSPCLNLWFNSTCSFHATPFNMQCSSGKQTPAGTFHQWYRQQSKEQEKQIKNPDLLQQFFCGKSYIKEFSWMLRYGLKTRVKWECNFVLSYSEENFRNNRKEIHLYMLYHIEKCSKL